MTKATKNISSAATHTKAQKQTTSTNMSNAARKKDTTAPAATDTVVNMESTIITIQSAQSYEKF